MSIIKIAKGDYMNEDALERVITHYVYPPALVIGGLGVDPHHAVEQMKMAKEMWGQTGGKQLHHFILRFSDWESSRLENSIKKIEELAYRICELFSHEHQIVFGIHDDGAIHVHFVLNSVNYRTGHKFVHKNRDDYFLADYIHDFIFPNTIGSKFSTGRIPVYYY